MEQGELERKTAAVAGLLRRAAELEGVQEDRSIEQQAKYLVTCGQKNAPAGAVLLGALDGLCAPIPLEACVEGNLYAGAGRNIGLSVLVNLERGEFLGVRQKFEFIYLDSEYHRDTGAPFGTYCARRDLGPLSEAARALFDRKREAARLANEAFEEMRRIDKLERPDDWATCEVQRERAKLPSHVEYERLSRLSAATSGKARGWLRATDTRRGTSLARRLGVQGKKFGEVLGD